MLSVQLLNLFALQTSGSEAAGGKIDFCLPCPLQDGSIGCSSFVGGGFANAERLLQKLALKCWFASLWQPIVEPTAL